MLTIDGSQGEGGGQIVRSSLALSLVSRTPFRITDIRLRRPTPGLRPQHLAAVRAAASIGCAEVSGDAVGSQELTFRPGSLRSGEFRFKVGTAGSAILVLQTVLPALALGDGSSSVLIEGGTHVPRAPPFEFLAQTYLPLFARMGPKLEARLERLGFYPAGGGRIQLNVSPVRRLAPLRLVDRGAVRAIKATAVVARLSRSIAEREMAVFRARFGARLAVQHVDARADSGSPGNYVSVEVECDAVSEVLSAVGSRGVRADEVATRAADEASRYLSADASVDPHLADQLILLLALAGSGAIRTGALTAHARTQLDVCRSFLGTVGHVEADRPDRVVVSY